MSDEKCPECGGATIEFRGSGHYLQWKLCSKTNEEPDKHLTKEERDQIWREKISAHAPKSGRFG